MAGSAGDDTGVIEPTYEKGLCDFCFAYDKEFSRWSGNRVYTDKQERFQAYNEFFEYAANYLKRTCVLIYFDVEQTHICLNCLTEMVERMPSG